MSANEPDLVEGGHREPVQPHGTQQQCRRAQVEALFDQAVQRQREQHDRDRALIERSPREALEDGVATRTHPLDVRKGVHHTELPEAQPGQLLADEWNTYRREVGRWLAEGQENRHVLIKGGDVIGFFDAFDAAYEAGWQQFPGQPFFVHAIRAEEPPLRIRGVNYPWPGSVSR